jgi:hypothetical protein
LVLVKEDCLGPNNKLAQAAQLDHAKGSYNILIPIDFNISAKKLSRNKSAAKW